MQLVHFGSSRVGRLAARVLSGVSIDDVAARLTEADLAAFPPLDLAETEEHNASAFAKVVADAGWDQVLERAARVARVDRDALERMCCQRFVLWHGRRMSQLRELLAMREGDIVIATDLPPELVAALRAEARWKGDRLRLRPSASRLLRAFRYVSDLAELAGLHAGAAARIAQLGRLPAAPPGARPKYAAWIGADAGSMGNAGPDAMSLPEFLADALNGGAVDEIVVQGAAPAVELPPHVLYRRSRFAARYRPPLTAIVKALGSQLALFARDLAASGDWRARQLLAHVTNGAVGTRLWLEHDRPRAVLYPNSVIGAEPAPALIAREFGVGTMMTFYSANIAHTVTPVAAPSPGGLEPEMRYIAADRLGMWSPEMRAAFLGGGYPPARLPLTGIVHYGRQAAFRRTSRFAGATPAGPVRIGVFDVSVQYPCGAS